VPGFLPVHAVASVIRDLLTGRPRSGAQIRSSKARNQQVTAASERMSQALWGPRMSATATRIATFGHSVSQALSLGAAGEGLRAAEDRGFEPRRVLPPNRISSAAP
jgi:hypothetical protein